MGEPCGGPTPVPTISPAPLVGPSVDLGLTWAGIDLPAPSDTKAEVVSTGLVSFHGSYVALGVVWTGALYDCGCGGPDGLNNRGLIWTSPDGRAWTLHDGLAAFAHASPLGIVTDGTRLVAYGAYTPPATGEYFQPVGATWVSTDGITWTRSIGLAPWAVVVADGRFVGATSMVRNSESTVTPETSTVSFVSSTDGLHWTRSSPLFDAYLGYQTMGAGPSAEQVLAATPSGAVTAVGAIAPPGPDHSVLWRSPDGSSWAAPEILPGYTGPQTAIASSGGAFLMVRTVEVADTGQWFDQVWRMAPGSAAVPVFSAPSGSWIANLYVTGDLVVATGSDDVGDRAWVSTDGGTTFSPLVGRSPFVDGWVTSVLGGPSGLMVSGTTYADHVLPIIWWGRGTRS